MDEAKRLLDGRTGNGKNWVLLWWAETCRVSFNPIICWWLGLHSIPGICLAWGDPALGPMGSMVGLMANSKRIYGKGDLPVPPSLWWASANLHIHRRPSNTSGEFWFSLLWGHCSSPLGLGTCKILLVPSNTGFSVSLSPLEVLSSNTTGSQGQMPWGFPVPLLDPQVGFRTFTTVWGLLYIMVLQSVGNPPSGYGIWFYHDCPSPTFYLWLLLCLWVWGIFFWRVSSVLLSMVVQ